MFVWAILSDLYHHFQEYSQYLLLSRFYHVSAAYNDISVTSTWSSLKADFQLVD